MKMLTKVSFGLLTATAILFGAQNQSSDVAKEKSIDSKQLVSEESLGLRKTSLDDEVDTVSNKTDYGKSTPMSGYKIERAFQDAPPMIPHDTEGMLPITINNNQCVSCHMPDVAPSMMATPIPPSHFINFRPKDTLAKDGFHKGVDNYKNEVSIKKQDTLSGARFNCTQCHAPQSMGELVVPNNFKPEYVDQNGANKSSWKDDKLLKGIDTLGKDSKVTKKDLENLNSPAGTLEGGH